MSLDLEEIKARWANIPLPQMDLVHDGGDETYFPCPMCDGDGEVNGECVSEYRSNAAAMGIQVYGIGDEHVALGKAIPHAAGDVAALIAEVERLRANRPAVPNGSDIVLPAHLLPPKEHSGWYSGVAAGINECERRLKALGFTVTRDGDQVPGSAP